MDFMFYVLFLPITQLPDQIFQIQLHCHIAENNRYLLSYTHRYKQTTGEKTFVWGAFHLKVGGRGGGWFGGALALILCLCQIEQKRYLKPLKMTVTHGNVIMIINIVQNVRACILYQ